MRISDCTEKQLGLFHAAAHKHLVPLDCVRHYIQYFEDAYVFDIQTHQMQSAIFSDVSYAPSIKTIYINEHDIEVPEEWERAEPNLPAGSAYISRVNIFDDIAPLIDQMMMRIDNGIASQIDKQPIIHNPFNPIEDT